MWLLRIGKGVSLKGRADRGARRPLQAGLGADPGGSILGESGDLSLQTPGLVLTHWKTVPKPILASSSLYSLPSPWPHTSNAHRLQKRKKLQINEKRGHF